MILRILPAAAFVLAAALVLPAARAAETVTCPDLATAVQVGTCPSDADLRIAFDGHCSADSRMNDKAGEQLCLDFQRFRKEKNVALWEAGAFQSYLSCDPLPRLSGPAVEMRVTKVGTITRVVCTGADGTEFAYRTKATCTVTGKTATCR
ncbi:MAG: hypothetical protein HY985_07015 [Magnetospirillum sp.]|nr:hypothetical protein [Magnetospirillum sp.]